VIPHYDKPLTYLTTDQMREVDRLMIELYHIELVQMMEHAGRNLAHLAREYFFGGSPRGKRIVVLAGTGGNGGGALVCARWLHNAGADVEVVLTADQDRLAPVSARQLEILRRMRIPIRQAASASGDSDLIIDGIIGYSLSGSPRGHAAQLITWANASGIPILALDVPSGVDAGTGEVFNPAISATATMTLALPKTGLRSARTQVGDLYLANIGIPPQLYAESSLNLSIESIFDSHDIVHLWQV